MSSAIAEIVDQTAAVAALLPGMKSVRGVGSGLVIDPLNPGQFILAAPGSPTGTFEHWSDLPDATSVTYETQDGTLLYLWDLPMRLWLPRTDLTEMRRVAIPFIQAYPAAMLADRTLGQLCTGISRFRFSTGSDDKFAWLDLNLELVEEVR